MSENTAEPRGYMSVCQPREWLIPLLSSKLHYMFNLAWLKAPMPEGPPPPPPPEAKELPSKPTLAYVFTPTDLPSKNGRCRFNGSGGAEADLVTFTETKLMKIDTGPKQPCRWV